MKTKEEINLSDDVVITGQNVKGIGKKIALCAIKNARRYAFGSLDKIYSQLIHDLRSHPKVNQIYSDGYDVAQECICFLCQFIGKKLGKRCKMNQHGKYDNIRLTCYKVAYQYLRRHKRNLRREEDLECAKSIAVDGDCLKEPEDFTRVNILIKKLNLTKREKNILLFTMDSMTYDNIAECLKMDRSSIAKAKRKIRAKYFAFMESNSTKDILGLNRSFAQC